MSLSIPCATTAAICTNSSLLLKSRRSRLSVRRSMSRRSTPTSFMLFCPPCIDSIRKSSIGRKLSALKSFFRFLIREAVIDQDPTLHLSAPKQDHPLPTYLPVDDMFRLLDAPTPNTPAELRDRAILEVLYSCGLRVSELTGLNWEDVDPNLEVLRVKGKGQKERIVPIGRKALDALFPIPDRDSGLARQ